MNKVLTAFAGISQTVYSISASNTIFTHEVINPIILVDKDKPGSTQWDLENCISDSNVRGPLHFQNAVQTLNLSQKSCTIRTGINKNGISHCLVNSGI